MLSVMKMMISVKKIKYSTLFCLKVLFAVDDSPISNSVWCTSPSIPSKPLVHSESIVILFVKSCLFACTEKGRVLCF
jgi:hypothetical protein